MGFASKWIVFLLGGFYSSHELNLNYFFNSIFHFNFKIDDLNRFSSLFFCTVLSAFPQLFITLGM